MTPQTFLLILRARWLIVLAVMAGIVALTTIVSLLLPKQYTATSAVIVAAQGADPVNGIPQPASMLPSYLATQVDIINSDRVASRVIKATGMNQSPTIAAQWRQATDGRGSFDSWLAAALHRNLDVRPSRESNVINVSFSGVDPRFAAIMANAFADAYVATNLELKVEPAKQYASFFDERVQQLRKNLETAQAKLTAFQRQNNIAGANNYDVETARLADLSTQLAGAQVQSAGSAARERQASGNAAASPDVINSAVVQQLRTAVAQQSAALQELASRLGPNHPQYQQQAAQVAELKAKLASEERQAAASVASASRADAGREASLRTALNNQRQRVLAASSERDALAVLQRDVDSAQKAYDSVTQRLNQSQLESQVNQTDVSVLTPATEPTQPSSPIVRLNVLLSIFVGGFLGVTAALVTELVDRRVRSESDLELPGIPLLASLSLPRREGRRWYQRLLPQRFAAA